MVRYITHTPFLEAIWAMLDKERTLMVGFQVLCFGEIPSNCQYPTDDTPWAPYHTPLEGQSVQNWVPALMKYM